MTRASQSTRVTSAAMSVVDAPSAIGPDIAYPAMWATVTTMHMLVLGISSA